MNGSREGETVTEDVGWRSALVPRVGFVAALMLAFSGVAVYLGFRDETLRGLGLGSIAAGAVIGALIAVPGIPRTAKAASIVAGTGAVAVAAYLIGGFLPGSALAAMVTLMFAMLLIGRSAFIILLLGFSAFIAALTVGLAMGFWSGPTASVDATDWTTWARMSAVAIFAWASVGFSVSFVINTIERNLAQRRAAVERFEAELADRRAAETARREAERRATESQKMEIVGHLAAAIAHDFNNALLVIKGWNELRGLDDASDEQREATRAIDQATEHSAQLGRQLLTFARKDVRTPKYLSLDKLVDAMTVSLRNLVGAKIELTVRTVPGTVVFADESQLQQLIYNLVINARDALAGPGRITVSVRREARDGDSADEAILEVGDDGPGIDPSVRAQIFEPFVTTKGEGAGTGLGLATVESIARQSGGRVDVESRPGNTVFTLRLPCVSDGEDDSISARLPRGTAALGLRILILEDDPQARKLIVAALTRAGNDVVACEDGDAAIDTLAHENEPFDLLCTDAVFPGASLATVLETFERQSPGAKVLVCSGYVREELAIGKLESGEYAYLAKPFDGGQLVATIREIQGGTLT